ncbi:MAG: acyltransferase [Paludibacteraceae bacterium]|nr:acyltransferase [Paludibacteraceae bacterium]
MFGIYRTLLALFVVFLHLGGVPRLGAYAVFGFYILSGYLMTLIMHRNYGYGIQGRNKYFINRFLRIYPLYWISCGLTIIVIFSLGETVTVAFHDALQLPQTPGAIIRNIALLFISLNGPRLTPPAWALTVELFYYACIGLGLSRTKPRVIIWFIISIIYHVFANLTDRSIYFPVIAAALPFSTGAIIYLYHERLVSLWPKLLDKYAPHILLCAVIFNWLIGLYLAIPEELNFYINFIINAALVFSLSTRKSLAWVPASLDRSLGDLSYPIYLLHFQAGLITTAILGVVGINLKRGDIWLALSSLPMIFFLSWMVAKYAEHPVNLIREKIKTRNVN